MEKASLVLGFGTSSREKLLEATLLCLAENGHAACSVKHIAARAGVNHGLVTYYFGSKEQMLGAALEHVRHALDARVPKDSRRLVPDFLTYIFHDPVLPRVLPEFFVLAKTVPAVAEELRAILHTRHAIVKQVVGTDDTPTAVMIIAAMFGLSLHRQIDPELPAEAAAQRLLDLLASDSDSPRRGDAPDEG